MVRWNQTGYVVTTARFVESIRPTRISPRKAMWNVFAISMTNCLPLKRQKQNKKVYVYIEDYRNRPLRNLCGGLFPGRQLHTHAGLCQAAPCGRYPMGQQEVHEHETPGDRSGGHLHCWMTSFIPVAANYFCEKLLTLPSNHIP